MSQVFDSGERCELHVGEVFSPRCEACDRATAEAADQRANQRQANHYERSLAYRLLLARLTEDVDMAEAALDEIRAAGWESTVFVFVRLTAELAGQVSVSAGSREQAVQSIRQVLANYARRMTDGE